MTKKGNAQKDKAEKLLEEYNDVFADIVNVNLYNGEAVVLENELEAATAKARYKADDNILHEEERDISKYWKKGGVIFALYAVENQTTVDKKMPLRIIAYDGANYRSQLLDKKTNRFYPCVSVVLYFGMEHWKADKHLKDILTIPKGLEHYVNDYQIHVVEVAWLTDEQVNMYKSDFRVVADYFTQKRKNKEYNPSQQTIKHVDAVLKMLEVLGDAEKFKEIHKTVVEKQGGTNMCEMMDRTFTNRVNERFEKVMKEEFPKRLERELERELPKAVERELPKAVERELSPRIAKEKASILLNTIKTLQKNLKCSLEEVLSFLDKNMEDYENARLLLGSEIV